MVKHLTIDLDNDLYKRVIAVKGERTWEKFFQDVSEENEKKRGVKYK